MTNIIYVLVDHLLVIFNSCASGEFNTLIFAFVGFDLGLGLGKDYIRIIRLP